MNKIKEKLKGTDIVSLIKYCLSGCGCFLLDVLVFRLMDRLVMPNVTGLEELFSPAVYLVISTYAAAAVARLCSSIINFLINKNVVFKKDGGTASCMAKYITLVVCVYLMSATAVSLLRSFIPVDATLIKICIDLLLMLFSYTMQRKWVFAKKDSDADNGTNAND